VPCGGTVWGSICDKVWQTRRTVYCYCSMVQAPPRHAHNKPTMLMGSSAPNLFERHTPHHQSFSHKPCHGMVKWCSSCVRVKQQPRHCQVLCYQPQQRLQPDKPGLRRCNLNFMPAAWAAGHSPIVCSTVAGHSPIVCSTAARYHQQQSASASCQTRYYQQQSATASFQDLSSVAHLIHKHR
jgi:hypothetical protein